MFSGNLDHDLLTIVAQNVRISILIHLNFDLLSIFVDDEPFTFLIDLALK